MISVYFGSGIGLKNLQIQGESNGQWSRDGLWRQHQWLKILSQLLFVASAQTSKSYWFKEVTG